MIAQPVFKRKCYYAITILYAFVIYGVICMKIDNFFKKRLKDSKIVQKGINEMINSYYLATDSPKY